MSNPDIDVTAGLADRGRFLRIQGQVIPPPGTTAGQVLTATLTGGVLGSNWQAGGTGSGAVNRKPAGNVTIADGFSLVVERYYTPGGSLTLQGDAALGIL